MGFKLGNIYVDRGLYTVFKDTKGNLLGIANQVENFAVEITSESKEVTDARGRLLQKIPTSKAGTVTLTSKMLHIPTLAVANGEDVIIASNDNKIEVPDFIKVASTLTDITLTDVVDGTVEVYQYFSDGTTGKKYTLGAAASTTQFVLDESKKLTLPKDPDATEYFVMCRKLVSSGAILRNRSNKFPKVVSVSTLALYGDPCETVRKPVYIECPSVQPSPDVTFDLQTDSTFEFKGDLLANYCNGGGDLYRLAFPDEEMEDED